MANSTHNARFLSSRTRLLSSADPDCLHIEEMILSDHVIREAIDSGAFVIDPSRLGTNSYAVRLGKTLVFGLQSSLLI